MSSACLMSHSPVNASPPSPSVIRSWSPHTLGVKAMVLLGASTHTLRVCTCALDRSAALYDVHAGRLVLRVAISSPLETLCAYPPHHSTPHCTTSHHSPILSHPNPSRPIFPLAWPLMLIHPAPAPVLCLCPLGMIRRQCERGLFVPRWQRRHHIRRGGLRCCARYVVSARSAGAHAQSGGHDE